MVKVPCSWYGQSYTALASNYLIFGTLNFYTFGLYFWVARNEYMYTLFVKQLSQKCALQKKKENRHFIIWRFLVPVEKKLPANLSSIFWAIDSTDSGGACIAAHPAILLSHISTWYCVKWYQTLCNLCTGAINVENKYVRSASVKYFDKRACEIMTIPKKDWSRPKSKQNQL